LELFVPELHAYELFAAMTEWDYTFLIFRVLEYFTNSHTERRGGEE